VGRHTPVLSYHTLQTPSFFNKLASGFLVRGIDGQTGLEEIGRISLQDTEKYAQLGSLGKKEAGICR
jgi:hypothetical protein